ncbi:MAG: SpoVR family protein [Bacteriovoracaceae bacterium]|nr:SpoVR family protein [Bacteriovoracaceae bacterium]
MNRSRPISGELLRLKEEIEKYAVDAGLDFPEVIFESCDYDTINILAAQGGFPNRYPHWKFGMDYDRMYKGYAYGMQKIYEMVVNTDPCYAYLLNANNTVDQKIVMAHVYAHADFFWNNSWFSNTNRKMMDVMANHGTKIRRYMNRYGQDKIEKFIDTVLSLDNLLDTNVLFEKTDFENSKAAVTVNEYDAEISPALRSFMRARENSMPHEAEVAADLKVEAPEEKASSPRDVLKFLMQNAPLEDWEADIIGILREEAYYFLPQRMTKIMNEGWASYWHSKIMTEKALEASEIIHFADHHAGVMAMSRKQLNPYKVGIELFRDIEYRWDTGRFGKEYNECTDMHIKDNWDLQVNKGREKIFEIRKTHNDLTFIDEFLTPEFCVRQQIFTYNYNPTTGRNEIDSREFAEIKQTLLDQLSNFGTPVIEVENSNFNNRSELLLRHVHFGNDLDLNQAQETIKNLYMIWKRPVSVISTVEDKETLLSFDGKEYRQS